jgi:hypothetical protein
MGKSSQSVDNMFRSLILQILQILKPREADLGCEKVSASIPPLGVRVGLDCSRVAPSRGPRKSAVIPPSFPGDFPALDPQRDHQFSDIHA